MLANKVSSVTVGTTYATLGEWMDSRRPPWRWSSDPVNQQCAQAKVNGDVTPHARRS